MECSDASDVEVVEEQHHHSSEEEELHFSSGGFSSVDESDLLGSTPPVHLLLPRPTYPCIFCNLVMEKEKLVEHIHLAHAVAILDLDKIVDFSAYVSHWRQRFADMPPPVATSQHDKLVLNSMEEDKELRKSLRNKRLQELLEDQDKERNSTFSRNCLFCKQSFNERKGFVYHLYNVHRFNIGQADNIVNLNSFISILEDKLAKSICLCCERVFKNSNTLKLHMRKKKHFKLNVRNPEYDQFYFINYLEEGKSWQEILRESDASSQESSDDWDEWVGEDLKATCLFCSATSEPDQIWEHIKQIHHFNLQQDFKRMGLDIYGKMKLINYIRFTVAKTCCFNCGTQFVSTEELLKHMEAHKFSVDISSEDWQDNKYLAPTLDNDALLQTLEDDLESDNDEAAPVDDIDEKLLMQLQLAGMFKSE